MFDNKEATRLRARKREDLDRRSWLRLMPVLAAAVTGSAQQPASEQQRIDQQTLHLGLKLVGIEVTDEQEAMMLPDVYGSLGQYEALRQIDIPYQPSPAERDRGSGGPLLKRARQSQSNRAQHYIVPCRFTSPLRRIVQSFPGSRPEADPKVIRGKRPREDAA